MKHKSCPSKSTIKYLENRVQSLESAYSRAEKSRQELFYDVLFLAFHLGLQRTEQLNNSPRFIPIPKTPKPKLMRRFWLAIQGR